MRENPIPVLFLEYCLSLESDFVQVFLFNNVIIQNEFEWGPQMSFLYLNPFAFCLYFKQTGHSIHDKYVDTYSLGSNVFCIFEIRLLSFLIYISNFYLFLLNKNK